MDDISAYPVGDNLCAYARDSVLIVGEIDSHCRCAARAATSLTGLWTRIKVGDQTVIIRGLGGNKFEILDEGRSWSLDSKKNNGDYCEGKVEPSS
jgi:hypothetical protein